MTCERCNDIHIGQITGKVLVPCMCGCHITNSNKTDSNKTGLIVPANYEQCTCGQTPQCKIHKPYNYTWLLRGEPLS